MEMYAPSSTNFTRLATRLTCPQRFRQRRRQRLEQHQQGCTSEQSPSDPIVLSVC